MDYDAFMEIVRNTRSIRRFRPDPVPDDSIDKIIEAARWAPSGFNQQPWEFVVVKDAAYRGKIAGWYGEYMAQTRTMETTREAWQKAWDPEPTGSAADFSVAPVYILLLGDTRTKPGLPMSMRYNPARQEYIFTASLANAFLYMHMAAGVLGLASQWVSGVASPYVHCLVKDLLGTPGGTRDLRHARRRPSRGRGPAEAPAGEVRDGALRLLRAGRLPLGRRGEGLRAQGPQLDHGLPRAAGRQAAAGLTKVMLRRLPAGVS